MLLNFLSIDKRKGRVYGLDIIRAWAILFVMIGHGSLLLPASARRFCSYITLDGVSIFFVLSGYLIGQILITKLQNDGATASSLLNFWKRRWFRTLPNYYLVLSLLVFASIGISPSFSTDLSIPYFYFGQNIFSSHPWFFPEAWSLSVEEWFYILIPTLIWIIMRATSYSVDRSILIVISVVIVVITYSRFYIHTNYNIDTWEQWDLILRKRVFTRIDSIMYGVIGAYISIFYKQLWLNHQRKLLAAGIVMIVGQHIIHHFIDFKFGIYITVFSFSVFSIGTLFLLPFFSNYNNRNGIFYNCITTISLISYSLYLIHLTLVQGALIKLAEVIGWSTEGLMTHTVIIYSLYWIVSIVVSILIYKYWELPMMNLRDR